MAVVIPDTFQNPYEMTTAELRETSILYRRRQRLDAVLLIGAHPCASFVLTKVADLCFSLAGYRDCLVENHEFGARVYAAGVARSYNSLPTELQKKIIAV